MTKEVNNVHPAAETRPCSPLFVLAPPSHPSYNTPPCKTPMFEGYYHPTHPTHPYYSDQRSWLAFLRRFGRLLNRFWDQCGEPAYWYGERSLTGLLCAAAWNRGKCGALEEFLGLRKHGKRGKSGRGDGWIYDNKNRWFTIEAKVRWPRRLSPDADALVNMAEKAIEESRKQLQSLDPLYKRKTSKTAICYLIPELRLNSKAKRPSAYQTRRLTEKLCHQFDSNNTVVGAFWCKGEPPRSRYEKEGKTYIYPGVIIVVTWWERIRSRQGQ